MQQKLISVIMSCYNESEFELRKSINSIIAQTYTHIEFIIVNDNPKRTDIRRILNSYVDKRIIVVENEINLGLVKSLNKALNFARGEYIARMDADDFSHVDRLEKQLQYLISHNLDLIGSFVALVDENDAVIKKEMRFPVSNKKIHRFMAWGNCISHPTWLARKEVYKSLGGYRNAPHCEDYDFLLRAMAKGFMLGNLPCVEVDYRVRSTGISLSNKNKQYLLRNYLSENRKRISELTEDDLITYLQSSTYASQYKQLQSYVDKKKELKQGNIVSGAAVFLINFFGLT